MACQNPRNCPYPRCDCAVSVAPPTQAPPTQASPIQDALLFFCVGLVTTALTVAVALCIAHYVGL